MNQQEAFQVIVDILKNTPDLRSKIPLEKLQPTTSLRKEMGFDSLAVATLFYELQDRYPSLKEETAARWQTLGDCANEITKA
jgi:acyl carrier protein